MPIDQKDIEILERLMNRNSDDVAVSISRSFERLEERIDAMESRIYTRLAEVEDRVESARQDISDTFGELRDEIRAGEKYE